MIAENVSATFFIGWSKGRPPPAEGGGCAFDATLFARKFDAALERLGIIHDGLVQAMGQNTGRVIPLRRLVFNSIGQ